MQRHLIPILCAALCLMLFGCTAVPAADPPKETPVPAEREDAPCVTPALRFFSSEEELKEALKKDEINPYIAELGGYFAPQTPVPGELMGIRVHELTYVAFYYGETPEHPDFIFEWYTPNWDIDEFKRSRRTAFGQEWTDEYFYVAMNEEADWKEVFWVDDGRCFHAGMPADFSEENMERYCDAKFVKFKQ